MVAQLRLIIAEMFAQPLAIPQLRVFFSGRILPNLGIQQKKYPPKTNSLPLKNKFSKRKRKSIPTIHFQVRETLVSGRN